MASEADGEPVGIEEFFEFPEFAAGTKGVAEAIIRSEVQRSIHINQLAGSNHSVGMSIERRRSRSSIPIHEDRREAIRSLVGGPASACDVSRMPCPALCAAARQSHLGR